MKEMVKNKINVGHILAGRAKLKAGTRLGKYYLEKCLGEGGSCQVWRAMDTVEGIRVALKIPPVGVEGEYKSRSLLREIRLLARLRHPHIMPVKNADIIDDYVVLVTVLSTKTLGDCSKPMSAKRIVGIIHQVLEGLDFAHRHHVVHCDVTPGNIFLFRNRWAALGDFGISLRVKRRNKTLDEFGTPGYVAPEQAYGRPTYRSDCFAVGLILYEYLTGVLPSWPFRWPPAGHKRLREKTSLKFVGFVRKAIAVTPYKRFENAGEMLDALIEATPKSLRFSSSATSKGAHRHSVKRNNWQMMRRKTFVKKYERVLGRLFKCVDCGEPLSESMAICPWCGSERNTFEIRSSYDHVCPRCGRGVLAQWQYCPWCYGRGFELNVSDTSKSVRYHAKCKYCGGKLARFMRYCPWCRRKIRRAWQNRVFPEVCGSCSWSVDSEYWNYCPWCRQSLV